MSAPARCSRCHAPCQPFNGPTYAILCPGCRASCTNPNCKTSLHLSAAQVGEEEAARWYTIACVQCQRSWHHRCHRPPLTDKELISRLTADKRGDSARGLRAWRCKRCEKEALKRPEVSSANERDANLARPGSATANNLARDATVTEDSDFIDLTSPRISRKRSAELFVPDDSVRNTPTRNPHFQAKRPRHDSSVEAETNVVNDLLGLSLEPSQKNDTANGSPEAAPLVAPKAEDGAARLISETLPTTRRRKFHAKPLVRRHKQLGDPLHYFHIDNFIARERTTLGNMLYI